MLNSPRFDRSRQLRKVGPSTSVYETRKQEEGKSVLAAVDTEGALLRRNDAVLAGSRVSLRDGCPEFGDVRLEILRDGAGEPLESCRHHVVLVDRVPLV